MTQPKNVIYLPPGVVPPPGPAAVPPPSGIPFDKTFFAQVLPASVQNFCQQAECEGPIVEVFTVDGSRHYVKGISGVADLWVALHTVDPDHDHDLQVFLPYQTIFRVEVHAGAATEQRRLGFVGTDGIGKG